MDGRKIFKRIFAVLLAIPMLVLLFGCATENELGIREKESKDMITLDRWGNTIAVSSYVVNRIRLNGEEGSKFICSTSTQDQYQEGLFLLNGSTDNGASSLTVESGTSVFWTCHAYRFGASPYIENETIWLEFINRKDGYITGYAVIRVDKIAESYFVPEIVKAVTFPKVFGKYQEITGEQINQLIKSAEK